MADPAPAAAAAPAPAVSRPRREFVLMLLLGAVGAGLALLAVRQGWARAVYDEPKPLPSRSITVTGQDMVPATGALALAGLACLAAIIATRGVLRRVAGAVLALCGVGAVVAASGSLSAARIVAAASSKVSSSASVASGGSGSTTGGSSAGASAGAVVTGDSSVHTVLLGVPWRVAVFAGAAALIAAGLLTVWRGTRWPVMSGRYERPAGQPGSASPARRSRPGPASTTASSQLDQAALWDSITRGDDPTLGPDPDDPAPGRNPGDPAPGRDPDDPDPGPEPYGLAVGPGPDDPPLGPEPGDPAAGPEPGDSAPSPEPHVSIPSPTSTKTTESTGGRTAR